MKKLLTIAMVAFAAVAAKADLVLYWSVAQDAFDAQYAVVQDISTGTSHTGMQLSSSGVTTVESLVAPFSENASYIIALLDNSGNTVAVSSETYLGSSFASYIYDRGSSAQPPANPYSFSGFVVPEPTSGLLLLLGMGALALKRKMV